MEAKRPLLETIRTCAIDIFFSFERTDVQCQRSKIESFILASLALADMSSKIPDEQMVSESMIPLLDHSTTIQPIGDSTEKIIPAPITVIRDERFQPIS